MPMHPLTAQHPVEPLQVREATAHLVPVVPRANQERTVCTFPDRLDVRVHGIDCGAPDAMGVGGMSINRYCDPLQ